MFGTMNFSHTYRGFGGSAATAIYPSPLSIPPIPFPLTATPRSSSLPVDRSPFAIHQLLGFGQPTTTSSSSSSLSLSTSSHQQPYDNHHHHQQHHPQKQTSPDPHPSISPVTAAAAAAAVLRGSHRAALLQRDCRNATVAAAAAAAAAAAISVADGYIRAAKTAGAADGPHAPSLQLPHGYPTPGKSGVMSSATSPHHAAACWPCFDQDGCFGMNSAHHSFSTWRQNLLALSAAAGTGGHHENQQPPHGRVGLLSNPGSDSFPGGMHPLRFGPGRSTSTILSNHTDGPDGTNSGYSCS